MFRGEVLNWPNLITSVRLISIPFFAISLISQSSNALILFLIIFIGDGIDGYIARKFNQGTYFGKVYDGLTDTLFFWSALIAITFLGKISMIYLILLILPRILTFSKVALKFLKTNKFTYETSIYRKMVAISISLLIFISLFKQNISSYALLTITFNYILLILEWFQYEKQKEYSWFNRI